MIKNTAELLQAMAALGWLVLAMFIGLSLRSILRLRSGDLTKLSVGPGGLTAEFVSSKLDDASRHHPGPSPSPLAKSVLIERLHGHAALLANAHILWVDDHPENNAPIVELLSRFGVDVELGRTNIEALTVLSRHPKKFDVLISDMGRDNEPMADPFPGIAFAVEALRVTGIRTIIFSGKVRPTSVPGLAVEELVELARSVECATFGRTNKAEELIHLILDLLERSPKAALS